MEIGEIGREERINREGKNRRKEETRMGKVGVGYIA